MLVNGVAICSLPTDLPYRSVKIAELGLSILKRGGEIILWAQWTGIGKFDPSFLSSIKGARYFISFQKASLRLWKDLQADSWESRLTISMTKFLKASLLLGAYLIDNKKVSFYVGIISKGLGIIHLSYNLNKCRYRR
jgi:hypothetical protein